MGTALGIRAVPSRIRKLASESISFARDTLPRSPPLKDLTCLNTSSPVKRNGPPHLLRLIRNRTGKRRRNSRLPSVKRKMHLRNVKNRSKSWNSATHRSICSWHLLRYAPMSPDCRNLPKKRKPMKHLTAAGIVCSQFVLFLKIVFIIAQVAGEYMTV